MVAFVDSNVFVYYVTGVDEPKARRCLALLSKLEDGEVDLATSELVVAEVVWLLQRRTSMSRDAIQELLLPLIRLPNLRLPNKQLWPRVFELYCSTTIDFTDAYNAASMERAGISEIYSYDKDFDKIDSVSRITP